MLTPLEEGYWRKVKSCGDSIRNSTYITGNSITLPLEEKERPPLQNIIYPKPKQFMKETTLLVYHLM